MNLRILAAILVMIGSLSSGPGAAQAPADTTAIRGIIEQQLAAFGRDDGPGAFAFASPGIREKFGSPEIFMEMVRRHYPPVYRPAGVAFQALEDSPRGLVQEVLLTGSDGRSVTALYIMERQPDGSWRIDGVYLLEAPDLTT